MESFIAAPRRRLSFGAWALLGLFAVLVALPFSAIAGDNKSDEEEPEVTDEEKVEVWGQRIHNQMQGSGSIGLRYLSPRFSQDDLRGPKLCETDQPVVIASGNKVLDETDFATSDSTFVFTRTYSRLGTGNGFGNHWRHPFSYVLTGTQRSDYGTCPPGYPPSGEPCPLGNRFSEISAHRPDGVTYRYTWSIANNRYEDSRPESTNWIEEDEVWSDSVGNHDITTGRFTLRREDGGVEFYSGTGRILSLRDVRGVGYAFTYGLAGNGPLQTVTHTSGRQISLTFDTGRFTSVTDPDGKVYTYGYNGMRLASVTYPDGLGTRT